MMKTQSSQLQIEVAGIEHTICSIMAGPFCCSASWQRDHVCAQLWRHLRYQSAEPIRRHIRKSLIYDLQVFAICYKEESV